MLSLGPPSNPKPEVPIYYTLVPDRKGPFPRVMTQHLGVESGAKTEPALFEVVTIRQAERS